MDKEELMQQIREDTLKYEQERWFLKKLHTSVNKIQRYDPEQMCVFCEDHSVSSWVWVEIPWVYVWDEWFQILIIQKFPDKIRYLKYIASEAVWRELIEKSDNVFCASVLKWRSDAPDVLLNFAKKGDDKSLCFILRNSGLERFQPVIVELAKQKIRAALDVVYRDAHKILYFQCVEYLAFVDKDSEAREFILNKWEDKRYRTCIIKMAEEGFDSAVEVVLRNEYDPDAKLCIENLIESGVMGSLKNNEIVSGYLLNHFEKWNEITKVGRLLSAMELADKDDPDAKKCICDYAIKGEPKAIDFVLSNLKDDDCWLCFASLAQMNENSKVAAKVLENKQYIMDFADEGDEYARDIVLGCEQYSDVEKCRHALQWAIEEDPCAIHFILESSRNDLIEELAVNGNVDALRMLVMEGNLTAIESMAEMGDLDVIKESARQGKLNAIKWLLENERIKDVDEIIVAGGRNIIEIIANLGCLEKIRDSTTSMLVKNNIEHYLHWLELSVETGSVVVVQDCQTRKERVYCIDDRERNDMPPDIQVISPKSRVGRELIGKRLGNVVKFYAPGRGMKEYKILKIS